MATENDNKTCNCGHEHKHEADFPKTSKYEEALAKYNTDLDGAMEAMRDEIMKHPMLIDHRSDAERESGAPQVVVRVTALGDSAITLRAWAWASTPGNAFTMKCDLLKSVKERFDREGIEIPYPYFNQIVTQG